MNASKLPKGQSQEVGSDGRPLNLPGIYVHTESGQRFITADGDSGVVQADAIVRQGGFERVGDVPTRIELQAMNKAQEVKDATAEALEKGVKDKELKEATKKATAEALANAKTEEAQEKVA